MLSRENRWIVAYTLNFAINSLRLLAIPARSPALSFTRELASFISLALLLTSAISEAISSDTAELCATFELTSEMPLDAWLTFSAISLVVAVCSSIAAAMVVTIWSISDITAWISLLLQQCSGLHSFPRRRTIPGWIWQQCFPHRIASGWK